MACKLLLEEVDYIPRYGELVFVDLNPKRENEIKDLDNNPIPRIVKPELRSDPGIVCAGVRVYVEEVEDYEFKLYCENDDNTDQKNFCLTIPVNNVLLYTLKSNCDGPYCMPKELALMYKSMEEVWDVKAGQSIYIGKFVQHTGVGDEHYSIVTVQLSDLVCHTIQKT